MNASFHSNLASWRIWQAQFNRFLLHWGWYVILSMGVVSLCSYFIADAPSVNSYQATLLVQVNFPVNGGGISDLNSTTTLFTQLLISPDTLNLALPKLNKLEQFRDLQVSDLQGLITTSAVTNTNEVQLTATATTPQDAATLVTSVYQAFLQKAHTDRSSIVDGLRSALLAQLKHDQNDLANTNATLQNLQATGNTSTYQYRLFSNLAKEQQDLVNTINSSLVTLGQQGYGDHDFVQLGKDAPDIATIPGIAQSQQQRLALSPLVGLLMGLGGVLLANRFSNRLPLRGKKRAMILPHITTIIPVIPNLRKGRLQALKQETSCYLPFLRRLHYQAGELNRRLKLITISSPKGREGKSTIAVNLALASTQTGLRTLLVDANAQRGALHTWFQLSNTNGTLDAIRSLAQGAANFPGILHTSITNLGLVPIGNEKLTALSNLMEEPLQVEGLRPFLEMLVGQADIVILDGPSLLNSTDAVNLASLSDMVVLVVDAKKSKSAEVLEAESLLLELGVFSVTVLNRAKRDLVE